MALRDENDARVAKLAARGATIRNLPEVARLAAMEAMLDDWLADPANQAAAEARFDVLLDAQLTVAEAQADQVEAAQRRSRLVLPGSVPPLP